MNLVPILSLCNIGAKLYSPICGDCRLSKLNLESDYPISVEAIDNRIFSFNKEGKLKNMKVNVCFSLLKMLAGLNQLKIVNYLL